MSDALNVACKMMDDILLKIPIELAKSIRGGSGWGEAKERSIR
jgi:hypothetical protein